MCDNCLCGILGGGSADNSRTAGSLDTGSAIDLTGWTLTEEGRLELAYDSGTVYDQKLVYTPGETPLTGPTESSSTDPDRTCSSRPGSTTIILLRSTTSRSRTGQGAPIRL